MANYTEYTIKAGNRWQVRGYLGTEEATGEQIEFNKRGFKTKKEAQVAYTRAKHNFIEGRYDNNTNKRLTFNEVYREWFDHYKLDVKESTANKTVSIFDLHILPKFGKNFIDKINHRLLQSAINDWHKRFKKYKMIYNYTKSVLRYAFQQGYIVENPTLKVRVPKKSIVKVEKKTKDYYNRTELQELLSLLGKEQSVKWYTLFRLLAFTGIRRGELLALTWKDVNFKEGLLSVNKTLTTGMGNKLIVSSPKTEASDRVVTLDDKTVLTLKQWKNEQAQLLIGFGFNAMKPDQLIFSQVESNQHLHLSAPRNKLARLCRLNNLDMINIHGFRHTHCSLLFDAGVQLKDVKERLGHEDIQTTMNIYTHVTEESKNNSAELFAKFANF